MGALPRLIRKERASLRQVTDTDDLYPAVQLIGRKGYPNAAHFGLPKPFGEAPWCKLLAEGPTGDGPQPFTLPPQPTPVQRLGQN